MNDDSAATAEKLGGPKGVGAVRDSPRKANVRLFGLNRKRMSRALDGMVERVEGGGGCHSGSV